MARRGIGLVSRHQIGGRQEQGQGRPKPPLFARPHQKSLCSSLQAATASTPPVKNAKPIKSRPSATGSPAADEAKFAVASAKLEKRGSRNVTASKEERPQPSWNSGASTARWLETTPPMKSAPPKAAESAALRTNKAVSNITA